MMPGTPLSDESMTPFSFSSFQIAPPKDTGIGATVGSFDGDSIGLSVIRVKLGDRVGASVGLSVTGE